MHAPATSYVEVCITQCARNYVDVLRKGQTLKWVAFGAAAGLVYVLAVACFGAAQANRMGLLNPVFGKAGLGSLFNPVFALIISAWALQAMWPTQWFERQALRLTRWLQQTSVVATAAFGGLAMVAVVQRAVTGQGMGYAVGVAVALLALSLFAANIFAAIANRFCREERRRLLGSVTLCAAAVSPAVALAQPHGPLNFCSTRCLCHHGATRIA